MTSGRGKSLLIATLSITKRKQAAVGLDPGACREQPTIGHFSCASVLRREYTIRTVRSHFTQILNCITCQQSVNLCAKFETMQIKKFKYRQSCLQLQAGWQRVLIRRSLHLLFLQCRRKWIFSVFQPVCHIN